MAANILVVTYDSLLGEFIQQGLEELGRFNVHVTQDGKKAITFLLETDCTLTLLDTGENKPGIIALAHRMHETRPALRIILVTETGWQEMLEELLPETVLCKPFSLPELIQAVETIYPQEASPGSSHNDGETNAAPPSWLSDVNQAAQQLSRLSLESASQAALITMNDKLWAYAGQLPQQAAQELAKTVSRHWDREEENDLVRYVHLDSTKAEHMLYATRLASGKVLALAFDAETPFSTIRSQASQIAQSLILPPAEEKPSVIAAPPQPHIIHNLLTRLPLPKPGSSRQDGIEQTDQDRIPVEFIFPPNNHPESDDYVPVRRNDEYASSERYAINPGHISVRPGARLEAAQDITVTAKSKATRKVEPDPAPKEADEVSYGIFTAPRKIVLEPVTGSVYNLDYVCLLIPRFSHHLLTGELAERLGDWLAQIFVAFSWRLEYISVRPEYLEWIANVPPATSPADLMNNLRRYTSEKIFLEFPRFKRENPSGDFWAPGYLIMGGSQPPPPQLIKDYITQTRQRQGLSQTTYR